jgi:general L-amino acid transport system substrate-binding protein
MEWIPMKALRLAMQRAAGGIALAATMTLPVLAQPAVSGPTLDTIRQRGTLICGVNTGLAGFAQPDSQGVWRGFDVDYCRAVAIALWNDPNRVRYVPTTAQNRFTALQSGEVDILSRNTTWTLSRDTSLGFDFTGINFYDGQGFMVKTALGVRTARELDGATICVQPGTTTEQNLTDWARANRVRFTPVVIERLEEVVQAYVAGRCDAYTTDVSGLASTRSAQPRPAEHTILPDVISKEPLGPLVRHGDQAFTDLVRWIHYGLLTAEELGLNAGNIAQAQGDARPDVQRLIGRTGDLGRMLGVDNAFMVNIVRTLGNYGEIFQRNLGPLGLQRGPNALWNQGGLQYPPPFR